MTVVFWIRTARDGGIVVHSEVQTPPFCWILFDLDLAGCVYLKLE